MTDTKLKEAIHVVARIAILNYTYEVKGKFVFFSKRIRKLATIIPLIFIEIINICFNKTNNSLLSEQF